MSSAEAKKDFEPEKRIFDESDVATFRQADAWYKLHSIFLIFIDKVRGIDVPPGFLKAKIDSESSDEVNKQNIKEKNSILESGVSPIVIDILTTLNELDRIVDTVPLRFNPERYGNMAFKDWYAIVEKYLHNKKFLLDVEEETRAELRFYLLHSFGSHMRLDYGTGHELNFIAYLGGVLGYRNYLEDISGREVLMIFATYYDLARRLISHYRLEPAGSHGVWGLDDHFHFIYILGAAQFNPPSGGRKDGYRYIPGVRQVLEAQTLDLCKMSNLYVNSIAFILLMKTGPFNEHSPIIFDIHRAVSLWTKVLSGLQKMYDAEVFRKFPVVQHFYFGNKVYLWKYPNTQTPLPSSKSEPYSSQESIPGLINGLTGKTTTLNNVSLTKAPWATNKSSSSDFRMSGASPRVLADRNGRQL